MQHPEIFLKNCAILPSFLEKLFDLKGKLCCASFLYLFPPLLVFLLQVLLHEARHVLLQPGDTALQVEDLTPQGAAARLGSSALSLRPGLPHRRPRRCPRRRARDQCRGGRGRYVFGALRLCRARTCRLVQNLGGHAYVA